MYFSVHGLSGRFLTWDRQTLDLNIFFLGMYIND